MTEASAAPPFVEYGGAWTPPPPISFTDVELWGFLLEADRARLDALCARFFETPSGGTLRLAPLGGLVLMSFADIRRGVFDVEPERGWAGERELTFWILGERQRRDGGGWTSEGIAAFSPYLFLDNPVAIATGREVVGYLKQAGWITLPRDAEPAVDFAADVYGAAAPGPEVEWGRTPFARIGRAAAAAEERAWSTAAAALRDIVALAPDAGAGDPGAHLRLADLPKLLAGRLPQMFLRQARATEDPARCAFQEIVEAAIRIERVHGGGLVAPRPLELRRLGSTPVVEELGLAASDSTGPGFRVRVDMRLETGRVLWRRGER